MPCSENHRADFVCGLRHRRENFFEPIDCSFRTSPKDGVPGKLRGQGRSMVTAKAKSVD